MSLSGSFRLARQLLQYAGAGLLATALHYALMAQLISLGWLPVSASTAGAVAGALLAYFMNRKWTFQAGHSRRRLFRFMAVAALGLLFNAVLLSVIYRWLIPSVPIAQVVTTALVFLLTFFINRHFTFGHADD